MPTGVKKKNQHQRYNHSLLLAFRCFRAVYILHQHDVTAWQPHHKNMFMLKTCTVIYPSVFGVRRQRDIIKHKLLPL